MPDDVEFTDLAKGGNVLRAIIPLTRHLKKRQPDVLISHLAWANMAAVIACGLARTKTKVVLVEHNDNSALEQTRRRSLASRAMQRLKATIYRRADVIVGVSSGVSEYIKAEFDLPHSKVKTIYNPIISKELIAPAGTSLVPTW